MTKRDSSAVARAGKITLLEPGYLTTAQVARWSGITGRTLLRWIYTDVVRPRRFGPPGKGSVYGWTLRDLTAAAALRRLRDRHSARDVRRAIEALRRSGEDLASAVLAMDARGIYRVLPAGDVVGLLDGGQVQAVALAPVMADLARRARADGVTLLDVRPKGRTTSRDAVSERRRAVG